MKKISLTLIRSIAASIVVCSSIPALAGWQNLWTTATTYLNLAKAQPTKWERVVNAACATGRYVADSRVAKATVNAAQYVADSRVANATVNATKAGMNAVAKTSASVTRTAKAHPYMTAGLVGSALVGGAVTKYLMSKRTAPEENEVKLMQSLIAAARHDMQNLITVVRSGMTLEQKCNATQEDKLAIKKVVIYDIFEGATQLTQAFLDEYAKQCNNAFYDKAEAFNSEAMAGIIGGMTDYAAQLVQPAA